MAINNLNPRRTVWFSPHEPSNKYDIWLSKNAHLDENGEPTTDSNVQRDCDYIFKIYDCGKWNPIVGFNTTAANKINIVPNHGENHVPLFLNQSQSPDELFDAGTMTDVLTNGDYVDWETVLGDEDFQHAWDVTVNNLNVRRADHEILGGVWADTFNNIATNGFAQCKFKNNSDSNLYVSGDDILGAIGGSSTGTVDTDLLYRSFYNSPTILKGWQESLYSAQKPRFELSGSRVAENRGKIPMLRNDDWWETHGSGYTGDYDDTNSALVWVDLPEGTEYSAGTGITISQQNEISINTNEALTNQVLTKTSNGVGWTTPSQAILYTAGIGIDIDIQNHEISLNIESVELGIPPSSLSVTNSTVSGQEDSIVITGNNYEKVVGPYEMFDYQTIIDEYNFDFSQIQSFQNTNPIYLRIAFKLPVVFTSGTLYICESLINNEIPGGKYIVTIQFGVVKFEKINIAS